MGLFSTVTGIVGGLFKKKKLQHGYSKFIRVYTEAFKTKGEGRYPKFVRKFMEGRSMTAKEKKECTKWVKHRVRNWNKGQQKEVAQYLGKINVKAEPKPKPVEVHKLSTSYKAEAVTMQAVAGIPKMAIYIGLGIVGLIGLFLLSKSFRRGTE